MSLLDNRYLIPGSLLPLRGLSILEIRRLLRKYFTKERLQDVAERFQYTFEAVQVPGFEGAEVMVRVMRPKGASPEARLPMIVWFHLGGYCVGSVDDDWHLGSHYLGGLGVLEHFQGRAVIASVEYRCAPEHQFPTAAEDCITATQWLQKHAREFCADPARVSVAGESSGGGLVAIVCQAARDLGFPLQAAVHFAPMLRRDWTSRASYRENGDLTTLPSWLMQLFWETYAPDPAVTEDPRCEPVRGVGSGRLAPCLVVTAEFDVLRDEGLEYYYALKRAGVSAEHYRYRATHASLAGDRVRHGQVMQRWSALLGLPESRL